MRYFTLQEAEALLPELERLFGSVLELKAKAEKKYLKLRRMEAGPARVQDLALERAQLEFLVEGMNEWLSKIRELGCLPKGLDPCLVDFPYRLSGREVYLCWRLGERRIACYHGLEEGFAGRRSLPEDVRR